MHLYAPANELFVADGYGNHRVAVFDAANGRFKRAWGANGGTPFNIVHSIRVSNDGLVYVADRGNRRVQVFTAAGEFKQQLAIGAGTAAMQTAAGLAFSRTAISVSCTLQTWATTRLSSSIDGR
jgi:DNA-binding beta-propeller fold protein YncE